MKRTILQKVQYLIQERNYERAMREVLQRIKPSAYTNNHYQSSAFVRISESDITCIPFTNQKIISHLNYILPLTAYFSLLEP